MNFRIKKLIVSFRKFRRAFVNYPFRKFNFVEIFLLWIHKHLTRSQFLILSGILVGLTAGLGGVISKFLVGRIQFFINHEIPFTEKMLIYAICPTVGILLTVFIVKYFFGGKDDKELSTILTDISENRSRMRKDKMYSQIIESAVTIGFGGSVGLETPIAMTGAAVGSNYAQRYRLGFKERTLLLAAGASAGIASAFDAPIAGVMFSFEILLSGLVFTDFIPLVIAAVCGSLLSTAIFNEDLLFHFSSRTPFYYGNLLFYIILGILSGFYARYYLVIGKYAHTFFGRFNKNILLKGLLGGILLSLLCVFFPPVFGDGYLYIVDLHNGAVSDIIHDSLFRFFNPTSGMVLVFLCLATLAKPLATAVTLGSGGNGGNFAPSLVAGGLLGYSFAVILHAIGFTDIPTTNLMLVGMAGVMSGAMYAPLTGIFLIVEVSGGYDLFVPAMIVSAASFAINRLFSQISPNYTKLAEKGEIFTTRQDQNILVHIPLEECMNPRVLAVSVSESMQAVLEKVRQSNQNTIAVVNDNNEFLGLLSREHLKPFLLNKKDPSGVHVNELMTSPSFKIKGTDSTNKVMKMFDEADVWQLPLIDDEHKFKGFVSRSAILKNYRKLLREYSE